MSGQGSEAGKANYHRVRISYNNNVSGEGGLEKSEFILFHNNFRLYVLHAQRYSSPFSFYHKKDNEDDTNSKVVM